MSFKTIGLILIILGLLGMLTSIFADALGVGSSPNRIGSRQLVGVVVGLQIFIIGMFNWLRQDSLRQRILTALTVILVPLAVLSVARGASKTIRDRDPCDLSAQWASGVLIREGVNPYRVFQEDVGLFEELVPPNAVPSSHCGVPIEVRPPLFTPMAELMYLPLSWLDLQTASVVWAAIQIICAVLLPLVLLRLNPILPDRRIQFLGVALLLAWGPIRLGLSNAQFAVTTTLLACTGIWFAYQKRSLWAGLCMGLALSKFSVTAPFLLFFVVYRHYKALGIALLTQVLGVIGVAILVGETPLQMLQAYLNLLSAAPTINLVEIFEGQGVISLDHWLNQLGLAPNLASLGGTAIGGALALLAVPAYIKEAMGGVPESPGTSSDEARLKSNLLLVILASVGMLALYHRYYDLPILFILITFLMGLDIPAMLERKQTGVIVPLLVIGALVSVLLIVPRDLIKAITIESDPVMTALVVVVFAGSVWTLYHRDALVPGVINAGQSPTRSD